MLTSNQQKFIDALRSGEFQQGKNYLHPGDGTYCCLGVACEVYMRETGNGSWVPNYAEDGEIRNFAFVYNIDDGVDEDSSILPTPVCQWLGLRNYSYNPCIARIDTPHGEVGVSAAECNDGIPSRNMATKPFAEIADLFVTYFESVNEDNEKSKVN